MERIDEIKTKRESKFWDQRMRKAEHHKKEMIKSNLIKNQTLIADPEIREKIDELREKRDAKRLERQNRHLNRNKLDLGLENSMDIVEKSDNNIKVTKKDNSKRKSKNLAKNRKLARNQKMVIKRNNKIEVE